MATRTQAISSNVLKARFDLILTHGSTRPSTHRLLEEVLTLREPIIAQSWLELLERASRCLGSGYAAFRNLQSGAIKTVKLNELERSIGETFALLFQTIAKSRKSAEFVRAMREKLEQSDPQARLNALLSHVPKTTPTEFSPEIIAKIRAGVTTKPLERIDFDDSIQKLASGKTRGVSLLEPFSPHAGRSLARDLDRTGEIVIMCLCRGLLGIVHAEFNLATQSVAAQLEPAPFRDVRSAVKGILDDFENVLRQGQQKIYGGLIAREPITEVADKAVSLAGAIEHTLPMFVRTQAAIRLGTLRLREQGKGTSAEQLGRLGVQAGALTREAIASHCASYRLAISLLGSESRGDVKNLLKRTESLPFAIELPNGKNTEIKKLDKTLDDAFVEVEGFVTAVEARRQSDGKLVSQVALLDPSSGANANAVAVFAHLPHAGVTKDAFCRINGIFRASSPLSEGKPAVEADVLPLGELSKTSWRIAFLRLADRWFQPWRNGANLYWSLGPHASSADGEGFLGAGELLFTPFWRR